ncbi:MAG: TIR domain-containing protein [Candidatus Limnocylindrales bacterium]
MPASTIFVGSSVAARAQAKQLIGALASPAIEFLPWWDAFTAGDTLLANLDRIRASIDAVLMVVSPESESTIRRKTVQLPNLNVLFEFGYFYGHFGSSRVAMIRYGEFYLPSDLGGYVPIFGSRAFKRGRALPVGKRTKAEFGRWVAGI